MKNIIVALLFISIFCSLAFAQQKQIQVDKIDEIQKLDKLMGDLDKLKVQAEQISKEKYYKCLKAFGDDLFCQCLRDNLPVGATFEDYIAIVTSTKEEFGYQILNDNDKKIVDITYNVREMCVNKRTSKPKK